MIVYLLLIAFLIIAWVFSCLGFKAKQQKSAVFSVLAFLALATVFSLRHPSMGIDLDYFGRNGYLQGLVDISKMTWEECVKIGYKNYEVGYIALNKLISCVSTSPQFLLIVTSVMTFIPVFYIFYKYSRNQLISTLVYLGLPCFIFTFSGLRQAIAVSIAFFSYKFIKEKKVLPFILTVLLATLFHKTAIIFLVAYPMYRFKVSRVLRYVSVALLPVLYVLRMPLFNALSIILKLIGKSYEPSDTGAITLLLVFALIYIFLYYYSDKTSDTQNGLLNIFYLAVFCQVFGSVNNVAIRIGYYFMIFCTLLIPEILVTVKEKRGYGAFSVYSCLITCAFVIFALYSLYSGGESFAMSYPYHFFFETVMK